MQDRDQEILRDKLVGIMDTYEETSKEIKSTLAQMNEAFELLMERPDQARAAQGSLPAQDEEGLEWEDVADEDAEEGEAKPSRVWGCSCSCHINGLLELLKAEPEKK